MSLKVLIILVAGLICWHPAPPAFAKGPPGIQHTVHNLSATGYFQYATNEDEICIFCHTPHGGTLDGPLWNRTLPGAAGWTHYTSATVSSYLAGANTTRDVNPESLLCLSCHDGALATNRVLNPSNDIGQPTVGGLTDVPIIFQPPGSFRIIGDVYDASGGLGETSNLTDDHPVSFSYYDVELEKSGAGNFGLRPPTAAELTTAAERPRFFGDGAVAGGMRVECSSCHDPHVDYGDFYVGTSPGIGVANYTKYAPFLIMSNSGSALCLACHDK